MLHLLILSDLEIALLSNGSKKKSTLQPGWYSCVPLKTIWIVHLLTK